MQHRHLTVALVATGAVIVVALGGTQFVEPGINPWARFWGIVFFALLLWPVGLTLIGHLFGYRASFAAGAAVVVFTAAQQCGAGTLPLPHVVGWSVSLASPGDAIRRELPLPPAGDPAWERAWSRAAHVAVAICTPAVLSPDSGVTVSINGGVPRAVEALERKGPRDATGWYNLPVTRVEVERQTPLAVEVRREPASGPPARFCGGQDDPARVGSGASMRWLGGRWTVESLADVPIPAIRGRPAPSRYYIELRFYDSDGRPHAGIWY